MVAAIRRSGHGAPPELVAKYYLAPSLAPVLARFCSSDFLTRLEIESSKPGQVTCQCREPLEKIAAQCSRRYHLAGTAGLFIGALLAALCGAIWLKSWTGLIIGVCIPGAALALILASLFKGVYFWWSECVRHCLKHAAHICASERQKKNFWSSLSWRSLETEVAAAFRRKGYDAIATKASGDDGIDVIAVRGNERIAIQCKQRRSAVGPAAVRELLGSIFGQQATRGLLVSTSGFTPGACEAAQVGPIELWGIDDLLAMSRS
jgi:restriction system protein